MANVKMRYVPWVNGSVTDSAALEEIFNVYPGTKYRLRRAFDGYVSCDQCNGDLAETDGWFSIATDDPDTFREFFDRDGWEIWEEHFAAGWYDDSVDYLTDEQKRDIVDSLVADGCDEVFTRDSVDAAKWLNELTYQDNDGTYYLFCCPSCMEAYQAAHPDVQLCKVR